MDTQINNAALEYRSYSRKMPKHTIIIFIIFYMVLSYFTSSAARSEKIIMIGENVLPISAFAGVISSISNVCLVILVLLFRKTGMIISVVMLSLSFPVYLAGIIARHNLTVIPGLFSGVFTIVMIVIIFLNHSRIEKEQEKQHRLFEQTAISLVNAIDAKDTYTHGHSGRVAEYSLRLAKMNYKSDEECEQIYYAALLHDVGKIGVPSSIINKAGMLTKEEYDVVKQHPSMGAQILENIEEYPYLSIGAHYHHERYDGKGYPDGLKGEEIPEIARIISVADAYDAMTSIRSYRDPIPQQKVREEIVMGTGTQFDPVYARLMIHLIDVDTEYEMQERAEHVELPGKDELVIDEHRSAVSEGILLNSAMTVVRLSVDSDDTENTPEPSMILFDSVDGIAYFDEKKADEMFYFEYGEVWFDGRCVTKGARKYETKIVESGSDDITSNSEYKIEAVRIRDHALIRISGKNRIAEVTVALPDSTRFVYVGFTGEHCRISDVNTVKADVECPEDYIPRIAEEISYVDVPDGDIPNVQVDGYRTDHSKGIEIRDGLKLAFHAMSLPTARLVWHCPFIDIFKSDDGMVNGENYRDLAFMRFDGEFWECDTACMAKLNVTKTDDFVDWEYWKRFNHEGFDTTVTFRVDGGNITIITENAGVSLNNTVEIKGIDKPIYAAVTGDQVAITNIRVG
ncbi:MAG: HD domain-containing protein [Lachnospiraceae bacterium]|nr:HD domain-containing protein [Lachnospiraceae bacterium]